MSPAKPPAAIPPESVLTQALLIAAYNGCSCRVCDLLRKSGPSLITPPAPPKEADKDG